MTIYKQEIRNKSTLLIAFAGLLLGLLGYRFFNLQVIDYNKYWSKAQSNAVRQISIPAQRGIIYDRNGVSLVDNSPIYDMKVIPVDVTDAFNYSLLSDVTGIPEEELRKKIASGGKGISRFRPYLIQRHIGFEMMAKLEEYKLELPGLVFSQLPARVYPDSCNLTHTLGYLRNITEEIIQHSDTTLNYRPDDIYGAAGLEMSYEASLRGSDGVEFHTVDILGRDLGVLQQENDYPAIPGNRLDLCIDARLQLKGERLLAGRRGAMIAMDPVNGDVLAFVSSPDYDLSSFVGPIPFDLWNNWNTNPDKPLLNRVINGTYPPGSVMKLVAVAAALENNSVSPDWTVTCTGSYVFGNRTYHCWNQAGHGSVNLKSAIKYSCNVYFYHLIQQMSLEQWANMAKALGFGSKTGIDLPYESIGVVPTKAYMNKKYTSRGWAKGNLLSFVIGQGDVLATTVQVVQMINLIATSGSTCKPHLSKDIMPTPFHLDLKPKTWSFLQQAIWEVVNGEHGTGKSSLIPGPAVIRGKTGTSENPHGEPHSWYAGYATLPNGHLMSIAVVVENAGKGSHVAAPIAKQMFQSFSDLYSAEERR